jgi:thymidylate synthase
MSKHRAFTHCINAQNVNDAMQYALTYLPYNSAKEPSRNGPVLVSNTPVVTCYAAPTQRVLFSPMRDANPFFHLFEALWMLAGRDDVEYPVQFNSKFGQFSDDGERFWGAYGYRWRTWFGYDQLTAIIDELKRNPATRRCVLSMWSPGYTVFTAEDKTVSMVQPDLMQALAGGKDVPCNTHIYFRSVDGYLDMMVNCRSNDIFWGAYGANAVHFSILLEYVATAVGLRPGRYWQNSFNFHAYTDVFPETTFRDFAEDIRTSNWYPHNLEPLVPLMVGPQAMFDAELRDFLLWSQNTEYDMSQKMLGVPLMDEPFLSDVCVPMRLAWAAFKAKDYPAADYYCGQVKSWDWRTACKAWITRRWEKHNAK